ncbi:MAG TPA: hypothetical protein VG713_06055 [Pirellulales bacterium]|nr:hypothetical protein [Pirellulales bacterium]
MPWPWKTQAWLVGATLALCAGCQSTNQRTTLDPFLRPATVPAPPTGAAAPPANSNPYYSAPSVGSAAPANPYSPPGGFNSSTTPPPPASYYQQGATAQPKLSASDAPNAGNAMPATYNQPAAPNRPIAIPTEPMPVSSPPRLVTLDPRPTAPNAAPVSTASSIDIMDLPSATRR